MRAPGLTDPGASSIAIATMSRGRRAVRSVRAALREKVERTCEPPRIVRRCGHTLAIGLLGAAMTGIPAPLDGSPESMRQFP